jgi:biotin carboxyl carrier protein
MSSPDHGRALGTMGVRLQSGDDIITVELSPPSGERHRCRVGDCEYEVELLHATQERVVVLIDGRPIRAVVARDGAALAVALGGTLHDFVLAPPGEQMPAAASRRGSGRVIAPMPGKVLSVLVRPGDPIAVGQPLVVLEAMKMEHTLTAEVDGTVDAVHVEPGDMVEGARNLLEIRPQIPTPAS